MTKKKKEQPKMVFFERQNPTERYMSLYEDVLSAKRKPKPTQFSAEELASSIDCMDFDNRGAGEYMARLAYHGETRIGDEYPYVPKTAVAVHEIPDSTPKGGSAKRYVCHTQLVDRRDGRTAYNLHYVVDVMWDGFVIEVRRNTDVECSNEEGRIIHDAKGLIEQRAKELGNKPVE